jgi:hypothetical protein
MIELVISLAMAFGVTQHGNTVRISPEIVNEIEAASGIETDRLENTNGYHVIHTNNGLLIVGTEQNGSGK